MATIRPTGVIFSFLIRRMTEQDSEELMNLLDGMCDEGEINDYTLARRSGQDLDELDLMLQHTTELSDWQALLRRFLEYGWKPVRDDSTSPQENLRRMVGGRPDVEAARKISDALDTLDDS
jgi:hypothetical protein